MSRRLSPAGLLAVAGLLALPLRAAEPLPLVRELHPLAVRGVNYFPRETSWGAMWPLTPPEVWERDMALAASLGCNTIRTFLQFGPHQEKAGLVRPEGPATALYHEKIEQLLAAAGRHGIRAILCFEFAPGWLAASNAAARWQAAMTDLAGRHRDDGRVLMWDLKNEPDSDEKWTEPTRAYLRAALPFLRQVDSNHLATVGLTWRVDRLLEVGLPEVMQYHEYAWRELFFREGPSRVVATMERLRRSGGGRPWLIGEFGMCTARDPAHGAAADLHVHMGKAVGTEAEQARLYEIVLAGAEQGGAVGALAWCLHDYPFPNPNESHFGLVRGDGSLKPAAAVLRDTFQRWSAASP